MSEERPMAIISASGTKKRAEEAKEKEEPGEKRSWSVLIWVRLEETGSAAESAGVRGYGNGT
jgi:hypothetical protein